MAGEMFLTIVVDAYRFGVAVTEIRDVLRPQTTTRIAMASPEIVGAINLRGRVVTVIDLRVRLGFLRQSDRAASMIVVVALDDEVYGLVVDAIGDVVTIDAARREPVPRHLDSMWISLIQGVHRLDRDLLLELDVARVISPQPKTERAA